MIRVGVLEELALIMAILVDTNSVQANEFEQLQREVNALKKREGIGDATGKSSNQEVFPNCVAVGHSAPHKKGNCVFDPEKKKRTERSAHGS